jgi:glucose-1-phosphate cytidylyltransferase
MQPSGRFGGLELAGDSTVSSFVEKPKGDSRWVNGGFFVVSPKVGAYIEGDETSWEREPLEQLAREGQVAAYKHPGYWQPMDTIHDKQVLEELWAAGKAPWRTWS